MTQQILIIVIGSVIGTILVSLLSAWGAVLLVPKISLQNKNKELGDDNAVLRKSREDYVAAVKMAEETRIKMEDQLAKQIESYNAQKVKYEETLEALGQLSRDYREMRLDFEWVKLEFTRVTGTIPNPRPRTAPTP